MNAAKRAIIKVFEKSGYVLVRNDIWQQHRERLSASETGQERLSEQIGQRDRTAQAKEAERVEAERAREAEHARQIEQLRLEAAAERGPLESRIALVESKNNRAEARVQALKRRRDRLQAELAACREQVARTDTSGRIRELEAENGTLRQRLSDLETYLAETRGTERSYSL